MLPNGQALVLCVLVSLFEVHLFHHNHKWIEFLMFEHELFFCCTFIGFTVDGWLFYLVFQEGRMIFDLVLDSRRYLYATAVFYLVARD